MRLLIAIACAMMAVFTASGPVLAQDDSELLARLSDEQPHELPRCHAGHKVQRDEHRLPNGDRLMGSSDVVRAALARY